MNTRPLLDNTYGGDATITKLVVAKRYMAAFNRALSQTGLQRHYVDGFAGAGTVNIRRDRFAGKTVKGSARIALDLTQPRFDVLRFVDRRQSHVDSLEEAISVGNHSSAYAYCGDANELIPRFCENLMERSARAFVFIDPFATEVAWSTVEALAKSRACDVLLMFPAGAVRQMLPREGMPPDSWEPRLDRTFGGRYWAGAYRETTVPGFWEEVRRLHTDEGFESIISCYRDRLVSAFTIDGVVPLGFPLLRKKHRPGTQLFELMFASANPRGQRLATKIASEIMEKAQRDGERLLDAAEDLVWECGTMRLPYRKRRVVSSRWTFLDDVRLTLSAPRPDESARTFPAVRPRPGRLRCLPRPWPAPSFPCCHRRSSPDRPAPRSPRETGPTSGLSRSPFQLSLWRKLPLSTSNIRWILDAVA